MPEGWEWDPTLQLPDTEILLGAKAAPAADDGSS
jgi:hypothetical protein